MRIVIDTDNEGVVTAISVSHALSNRHVLEYLHVDDDDKSLPVPDHVTSTVQWGLEQVRAIKRDYANQLLRELLDVPPERILALLNG